MRKTKILCTLGPASSSKQVLRELINAGMNGARFNFSHGTYEEHKETYDNVRAVARELGKPVATMQDLQGPKIRTGRLKCKEVLLEEGKTLTITTRDIIGDQSILSTTYKPLPQDVKVGDSILLDDGAIALKVTGKDTSEVETKILNSGCIGEHKGINLPGVNVSAPAVTEKDFEDLKFGLELGFDYVALSFVRRASDLAKVRNAVEGSDVKLIAKIEKPEAVENIHEILEACDGIMVARGDLGVEIPIENVPFVQKMLIREANREFKPVIVATQMLESMIENPRPTRAEASDVANSILDKADVIMLSGETAIGKYPVDAVKVMAQIAKRADSANPTVHDEFGMEGTARTNPHITIASAVSHAASLMADELDASAILTFTESGSTAVFMSKYRPETRIIALTTREKTRDQLALLWGVNPFVMEYTKDTSEMILKAEEFLLSNGCVNRGETVVVTAGIPSGRGITNVTRVVRIGEKLGVSQ